MMSQVETCPWQFSYASLGSRLILAKRIAPPTPAPFVDAEAVRNVPPTPVEAPHKPSVLPAPVSGVPALEGDGAG